jgi:hypothetical protein
MRTYHINYLRKDDRWRDNTSQHGKCVLEPKEERKENRHPIV